jgi:hypothetical protein
VVELRVHGILGTTGSTLTDSVASVDVAGDSVGRIVSPADRLRRPVPGPALTAGERRVSRLVEGYVWSRTAAGGLKKAAWALLFPFALANVADWMLPPCRRENQFGRTLSVVLRGLLRMTALFMTMLLAAQLTVITLDVFAAQCLQPASSCMEYVPDALRTVTVLRSVLALLPVSLIILLLHRLSTVSWKARGGSADDSGQAVQAPILPGANIVAEPEAPALRAFHVCAALSTVALVALGGPFAMSSDPRWILATAVLVLTVAGTALLNDPTGLREKEPNAWPHLATHPRTRQVLRVLSALPVVTVAFAPPPLDGPLPGTGSSMSALIFLLLLACVATAIVLLVAVISQRSLWAGKPRRLRPWAGGWMAAPVLVIACLLGAGFGAGIALCLRQLVGTQYVVLPPVYNAIARAWGSAAVLILISAILITPLALFDHWRRTRSSDGVPAEVALLHAGRQQDQHTAANAWRWAELQRRHLHRLLPLIAGALTVGLLSTDITRSTVDGSTTLAAIGVAILIAVAGGLLRMVSVAAKHPDKARFAGVLCDLTLLWPREAHPFVPPCSALRVVPELVARANEHLKDPGTRVVLVGHSQGSLLAAVATARLLRSLDDDDRQRVGLVTSGSQLQWAYPRAFPGVVPHDALRELAGALGGRWRSLCRGTDPLGGGVTTWNRQVYDGMLIGVGFRDDGTEGPLPSASRGPTGALVLGGDHWLPDPQRGPFESRRWMPGVLAHADYSGDPEWDRAVSMAAGLETSSVCTAALPLNGTVPVTGTPADDEEAQAHGDPGEEGSAPGKQRSELPEIIDPRGRVAPWERAQAARPSGH